MKDWILHNGALPAIYIFLRETVYYSADILYMNLIYMDSALCPPSFV